MNCWMLTVNSGKSVTTLFAKNWSSIVDMTTSLSPVLPGTFDKSITLLLIVKSSWIMAWYVHWFNNGVTGSFRLSRISTKGWDSRRLFFSIFWKTERSSVMRVCNLCATISAIGEAPRAAALYRTTGNICKLKQADKRPSIILSKTLYSTSDHPRWSSLRRIVDSSFNEKRSSLIAKVSAKNSCTWCTTSISSQNANISIRGALTTLEKKM
mmetsp:Transcript_73423/g.203913  ORF Transcript_73423/g.203913 Transcript_73423/m.203913 type:complete len:211 (+) Transcript_73423:861-1493(+)